MPRTLFVAIAVPTALWPALTAFTWPQIPALGLAWLALGSLAGIAALVAGSHERYRDAGLVACGWWFATALLAAWVITAELDSPLRACVAFVQFASFAAIAGIAWVGSESERRRRNE